PNCGYWSEWTDVSRSGLACPSGSACPRVGRRVRRSCNVEYRGVSCAGHVAACVDYTTVHFVHHATSYDYYYFHYRHYSDKRVRQVVDEPLLVPTKLCANVNSPSLTTRAVKYSEHGDHSVLTHQPQYAGVGLFPSVQLNKSAMKLPTWSPGAVSRLTSSYSFLDRSQILSENRGYPDQSTKNVLEVLREISRKRIHS
ncbi:unnamed protein product, partial [Timema podura]|nr:unnamed protein product [Timema podura]